MGKKLDRPGYGSRTGHGLGRMSQSAYSIVFLVIHSEEYPAHRLDIHRDLL